VLRGVRNLLAAESAGRDHGGRAVGPLRGRRGNGCTGPAGLTGAPGSPRDDGGTRRPAGLTGAQGKAAPKPAPLPAIRRTSLQDIVSESDQAENWYSESRKFAEIAAYMSQNPSVWVAIDGYTGRRASQCRGGILWLKTYF
jgi:hypothetical protein